MPLTGQGDVASQRPSATNENSACGLAEGWHAALWVVSQLRKAAPLTEDPEVPGRK